MSEFDCPACGSDDVRGERHPSGTISLTCQSCETSWARVPKPSCPRCGRGDVEEYGGNERASNDPGPGQAHPEASGRHRGGGTFRCRRCHHTWGQVR